MGADDLTDAERAALERFWINIGGLRIRGRSEADLLLVLNARARNFAEDAQSVAKAAREFTDQALTTGSPSDEAVVDFESRLSVGIDASLRLALSSRAMVMKNGKDAGGRPPHVPTPATRGLVELAAGLGASRDQIAHAMALRSHRTLEKHYTTELGRATLMIRAAVANTYVAKMLGGTGTEADPYDWNKASVPMLIHYTKSRMGWGDSKKR